MTFPRLYVIADAETLRRHDMQLRDFAAQLHSAGVTLVQLRDKAATPATLDRDLAILREELPNATLILNDRPHPGFDGVHLGQEDGSLEAARAVNPWIGLSTHTPGQVSDAESHDLAYIAIGPVFATSTKPDPAPVVGLEGIDMATERTNHPIVAIGGITRENCRTCIEVGADSVAVISALFAPNETVEQVARDFLRILS